MTSRILSQRSVWQGLKRISNTNIAHKSRFNTALISSRCLTSTATKLSKEDFFSIKDILPPQDAFAKRHIGPRKEERNAMLAALDYNVRRILHTTFFFQKYFFCL